MRAKGLHTLELFVSADERLHCGSDGTVAWTACAGQTGRVVDADVVGEEASCLLEGEEKSACARDRDYREGTYSTLRVEREVCSSAWRWRAGW